MKRWITVAAIGALALGLGTGTAFAAGESCQTAIDVLQGVTTGNLGGNASQWYAFTVNSPIAAPEFGFNTHYPGTDFDTILSIYDGCGGTMIAHNEGAFPDRKAFIRTALNHGQTYYVEVSKLAGSGTAFQLGINEATVGGCGGGGTGDCFVDNGSPFCADTCGGPPCPGCCNTVCAIDSFCCSVSWDGICAGEAASFCTIVPVELQTFDVERR